MSKGSRQRPCQVSKEKFDNNWDSIFKKKEVTPKTTEETKPQVESDEQKND